MKFEKNGIAISIDAMPILKHRLEHMRRDCMLKFDAVIKCDTTDLESHLQFQFLNTPYHRMHTRACTP